MTVRRMIDFVWWVPTVCLARPFTNLLADWLCHPFDLGRLMRGLLKLFARMLVDFALWGLALWVALPVVNTFVGRWSHPYDLEWMEGGMLVHAWRIQNGLPLYTETSIEWIPYLYPPGYPAVVALLGAGGLDHSVGRAVSVAATIGTAAALVYSGFRRGRVAAGVAGVAVFLSCYVASGSFYDLVRPDALAIAFLAWSIAVAREREVPSTVLAGLLLAAGFTVKHNVAVFGLPLMLGIGFLRGWRHALLFGCVSVVPALAFTGVMQVSTGGHFLTTLLDIAASHGSVGSRWMPGAFAELTAHLGPVVFGCAVTSIVWLIWHAKFRVLTAFLAAGAGGLGVLGAVQLSSWMAWGMPRGAVPSWQTYTVMFVLAASTAVPFPFLIGRFRARTAWVMGLGLAIVALGIVGMMRAHVGGFINVYMPLHLVVAMGVVWLLARFDGRWSVWIVVGLLVHAGRYEAPSDRLLPTAADIAAGDHVVDTLRRCEGPVLSPDSPWLPVQAGHKPMWHTIAMWDIRYSDGPYYSTVAAVHRSVRKRHWACIVVGRKPISKLKKTYELRSEFEFGRSDLMPRVGWPTRPAQVWVPKEE